MFAYRSFFRKLFLNVKDKLYFLFSVKMYAFMRVKGKSIFFLFCNHYWAPHLFTFSKSVSLKNF